MKRPLLISMIFLIAGILTGHYIESLALKILIFPVAAGASFYLAERYCYRGALLFVLFWLGGVVAVSAKPPSSIADAAAKGEILSLSGTVTDVTLIEEGRSRIIFKTGNTFRPLIIQASLKTDVIPKPGHRAVLTGRLIEPNSLRTPGGYNEKLQLSSVGIRCKMNVETFEQGEAVISLSAFAGRIRAWLSRIFDRTLPPAESGLMKSMILGDDSDLEKSISKLYKRSGIFHVIVISGFHISVLSMAVYYVFSRVFSVKTSSLLNMAFIIFYCILTGAGTATTRAVIVALTVIFGRLIFRSGEISTSAALSAILMLLYRPYALFNPGFQLSFSAFLGLGLLAQPLEGLPGINRLPPKLRTAVAANLAVTLVTSPIIAYTFNYFSTYSIIINLLILPTISLVVVLGFAMAVLGSVNIALAHILSGVVYFLLIIYENICILFTKLPFSYIIVGGKPVFVWILFYVAVITMAFWLAGYKKAFCFARVSFLLFILSMIIWSIPTARLRVTMLDVGEGDCFIIEHKGDVYIVDGGGWPTVPIGENTGENRLIPYLNYRGITKIAAVFVSHTDADHSLGIVELVGSKNVGRLILPAGADDSSDEYLLLKEAAQSAKVDITFFTGGQSLISRTGIVFNALWPDGITGQNPNESSLVLKMTFGEVDFLFTGDIGFETENYLLSSNKDISARVLKVGHHGSKYSTSLEFIEKVKPEYAIISASLNNPHGHPSQRVMETLSEAGVRVYTTSQKGTVIIYSDGKGLQFEATVRPAA